MILAAVDLGTVTSRMLVGKVSDGKVQVLKRSIEITDMGEGLADSGVISDSALARVSGALLKFKEDLLDLGQWGRGGGGPQPPGAPPPRPTAPPPPPTQNRQ